MKKRSLDLIIAIMLVFITLLSGGLAEAYLAPDYTTFTGSGQFDIGPGVLPDYLTAPNWAFSPPLRKFIDPLPGLCVPTAANSFCASSGMTKNIPVAVPDVVTYPGSDYYVIELQQYTEKMHTDLANPTTLRGYVQVNQGTNTSGCDLPVPAGQPQPANPCTVNNVTPAVIHFLGPVIVATKDRPVRVLFRNKIDPVGDGNLFLPVDDTIMGAGAYDINYNPVTKAMDPAYNPLDPLNPAAIKSGMFSTNRATLHLHGGRSPWISDGTPHQWITPAIAGGGPEDPIYPQGISVENVPDMPTPAVGEQTFYWTNQQSSRMMFYHDHAWGITRLNVYAGEAAGYLIRDNVEKELINTGIIPGTKTTDGSVSMGGEIPLVIMDKTFVDAEPLSPTHTANIDTTDPTWNWGTGAVVPGNNGVITWITVTEGGSGYDPAAPPTVDIVEGGNLSAAAVAVVSSVISSIDLTTPYIDPANPGSGGLGYVAPLVLIDDLTGSGAAAEAAIDANGTITGITIISGGWDYSAPVVTIVDQNNDNYTAASASATIAATVSAVAVTNGGTGYTNPTVTIAAGTGVQATAVATVTDIRTPKTGDLWWPHVYMPAQNPFDVTGVAPMGRWAYGPYFYPATNNQFQPIPNPYYSPSCDPLTATIATPGFLDGFCQAPEIPSTPNPSWGAEAFMDTPLVNGTAYPYLNLEPKAYRLRILNAAHDRFMNLSLVIADTAAATEVKMIDAAPPLPAGCPATWPADGRAGGIPDCSNASNLLGPNWIMIGNEGGFLPMPVVIPPQPVTWNVNPSMFNVGNINGGSLILGPAERADVIVDFSDPKYIGQTLILYNDGAAPWPALNPQYDFYTGNPDGTASGSAPSTVAGFGPNTRTIMQINICDPVAVGNPLLCSAAPAPYDLTKLQDAFDATTTGFAPAYFDNGVFRLAQDPIIAAQGDMNPNADPLFYETYLFDQDYSAYSRAYGAVGGPLAAFPTTYPNWGISRINDSIIKLKTFNFDLSGNMVLNPDGTPTTSAQSIAMKRKSIHDEMGATFDDYGRMRAALGLEKSNGGALQVNFIVQTYSSPVTEDLLPDGIQVWKITHNGVDTHPIHFHLFDVQVLNRVGWDGFIRLPDPTELGWKETVRISPLEDTIVAIKPVQPTLPFGLPESYRPLNPATPIGSTTELTQFDPVTGNPRTTVNAFDNFAWEYVWHCHILSHEENDMMRAMKFHVVEAVPADPIPLTATLNGAAVDLVWTDNAATEISYTIQKSVDGGGWSTIGTALANATTLTDAGPVSAQGTYDYRVFAIGAQGNSGYATAQVVIPFHITVTQGANGAITPAGAGGVVDVAYGADQTFTITPNANYHIQDVTVDGGSVGAVASYTFNTVIADHTITATFNLNEWQITAAAGAGGAVSPSGTYTVPATSDQTVTMTPNAGYMLTSITVDGAPQGSYAGCTLPSAIPCDFTFTNVTGNHSIASAFTRYHVINASAGTGGVISPSGAVNVLRSTNQAFTITPNAGTNLVSSIVVDGVAQTTPATIGCTLPSATACGYTFSNVTTNHSIIVSFVASGYNINASASAGGVISPSGAVSVARNANQTFTMTPNAGTNLLLNVIVDGTSRAVPGCTFPSAVACSYTFTNVTSAHSIVANFVPSSYNINASASAGGVISPSGAVSVARNANQTFTMTPNAGTNLLLNVIVDGGARAVPGCTFPSDVACSYTFTNVTSAHSIVANFVPSSYTVTTSIIGAGTATAIVLDRFGVQTYSGAANPSVTVPRGGRVDYTFTPTGAGVISQVTADGTGRGAVTNWSFTNVTSNHSVQVRFVP